MFFIIEFGCNGKQRIFFFKIVKQGNFWNALHDTKRKFVICWIDFWSIIKNGHWKNFFNIYKQTRDLASEKALKHLWNPIFNFWFWFWRSQNILYYICVYFYIFSSLNSIVKLFHKRVIEYNKIKKFYFKDRKIKILLTGLIILHQYSNHYSILKYV